VSDARVGARAGRIVERTGWELVAVALAVVPIAAAFVRSVVNRWIPVGDNALVEIRARDVFSTEHFPLLGTWSSASRAAGKDLNHPGPLLFDLLAVPVKVFGGPVGIALGVSLINAGAVAGVAVATRRVGGRAAALVATAVAATLSWTLGSELLISPWNPHVLVLPCLLLLVLAWGVAAGDIVLTPWMVAVGSLCLQSHVGYAYLVPAVSLLAIVGAVVVFRRRSVADPTVRANDARRASRLAAVSVATVVVLWAQPMWEQLTGPGQGNLARLATSSGGDEAAIGLGLGARIVSGVVALPPWWGRTSFLETVPFTPLDARGRLGTVDLPGLRVSLVGLMALVGLLAAAGIAAYRRRDRPAFVASVVALAVVVIGLATFAVVPIGTLGLTAHQMRWVWSLGAFVALVLLVNAVRSRALSQPSRRRAVELGLLALVGVLAVLNLPSHLHRDGPAAEPHAQGPARELSRQIDHYEPESAGVVFETDNLRFSEPYSTVVMSALQRNGIDLYVEDHGLVRQLGEARRFDGTARTRLFLLEDRPALDVPSGATLVALATPLAADEVEALVAGEREMAARVAATGLVLTPTGVGAVESGALGVTADEIARAAGDAERLVAIGAVARLTLADALELAPADAELFRRIADLRGHVDLRTVAVFAETVQ
jgi:hypothetical protein